MGNDDLPDAREPLLEGQFRAQVESIFKDNILFFVLEDDPSEANLVVEFRLDHDAFLVLLRDLLDVDARQIWQSPFFQRVSGHRQFALHFWG